jgi:FMN phosphatase YigB (HAD superfamily)
LGNTQKYVQSFLKMRWGLERIRFVRHPVTILVSSDFVRRIQIRSKAVEEKQSLVVAEDGIGSLSGLIAGSLSAFQKTDQGLLQVSYTTITSEVGAILLKKYLSQRVLAVGSEPVRLNRIKTDGELSELVYERNEPSYPGIASNEFTPGKESWILEELLNENRSSSYQYYPDALILTNVSTRNLMRLFQSISLSTPPYQGMFFVFLGDAALNRNSWDEFNQYLQSFNYVSNVVLGIDEAVAKQIYQYCSSKGWTRLEDAAQVIAQNTGASVLFFQEKTMGLVSKRECTSIEFKESIGMLSLSRGIAGFSLGMLVNRCLGEEPNHPDDLVGSVDDALRLAKIFADTQPEIGDFVTEEKILYQLELNSFRREEKHAKKPEGGEAQSGPRPGYLERLLDIYRHSSGMEGRRQLFELVQQKDDLITSAAIDRLKRFGEWEQREAPEEDRVVFLDLDLTLFDYTLAREKGARAALAELSMNASMDRAMELYNRIVDHWRGFEFLGLPNVRRLWNVETIYYLVYLFASKEYRKQFDDFFGLLNLLENAKDEETRDRVKRENAEYILMFSQALNRLYMDVQLQQETRRAYVKFEEATAHLEPFSDAKDLLKTLLSLKGYHVFVLTEGSLSVQWEKVEKLGLQNLIKLKNVLVTEALSNPNSLIQELLLFEQELIIKKATGSTDREISELQLDAVDFLNKLFGLFTYKRDRHFYGHALHMAVKQINGGIGPYDFANISPTLWSQLKPVKLATVGDRYSNDIKPLANIFGPDHILSIHLPFGKYLHDLPGVNEPKPDYTVSRLAGARNILVRDEPWQAKLPLPRPQHFYINFDREVLCSAMVGLVMPKPVHVISEAILQDAGFDENDIDELKGKVASLFRGKGSGVSLEKRLLSLLP